LEITTERIGRRYRIEVAIEPENVQNGCIRADRDTHAAILNVPQRRHGHAGPLRNELGREPAPKPSGADSFTETRQTAFHRR